MNTVKTVVSLPNKYIPFITLFFFSLFVSCKRMRNIGLFWMQPLSWWLEILKIKGNYRFFIIP